ncbi:RagB/SusD family nutrient uptake outer membrane protein [Mangrovibacterium sp.]|uniref:RagB/SusD family nutrient uptake outer membrane protein n=1 Tax=Mangrovibacterium sp. TaxID=1961364 RepID=UPI0035623D78
MKRYIINSLFILALLFSFSCEDYLDKAPESTLAEEDVFKDFDHAQGFVEEIYMLVVDYGTAGHTFQEYIFGDDAYSEATFKASSNIDRGNLAFWSSHKYCYLNGNGTDDISNSQARNRPGLWDASLQGIRKANIAIQNIDLMVNATQDERDVILGQAYFFRAFFHNEIMKFWGRFPYIKEVITDDYELPRPATYKECALEANEDYKKAIELLPVDWDTMPYGQKTLGENKGRVTKGAAYAFQGKNLLFAASPLMHSNNESSIDTYVYDTELSNMAVDAFAKVLDLVDEGVYALVPFDQYEEVFWKSPSRRVWPGSTELIFTAPGGHEMSARRFMTAGMDSYITAISGSAMQSPTHNFIYNNFGMANGLSIEDDMSGAYGTPTYDPNEPFENRDPRFYKWIVADGDVLATKATAPDEHKFAQLYTGGEHRVRNNTSKTGYFQKKFYPTLHSRWNNIISQYIGMRLHMRLTDVYLMYAEALHAAKGATTAPTSYNLTAEGAINALRDRAGIPRVNSAIVANANKFMDELRRERSVELSYEAHRWVDIRRWGVAHLDKYKIKTALDFPQDHSYFREYVLTTRVCDYPKHFWLPFEANQTQFYEGFPQNPGW